MAIWFRICRELANGKSMIWNISALSSGLLDKQVQNGIRPQSYSYYTIYNVSGFAKRFRIFRGAFNNVSARRARGGYAYVYTHSLKPGTSTSRARRALTLLNAPPVSIFKSCGDVLKRDSDTLYLFSIAIFIFFFSCSKLCLYIQ